MGNYARLYTLDDAVPQPFDGDGRQTVINKSAKYHLPVLWLACFAAENLVVPSARPCGANADDWPYFVCTTKAASIRLASRASFLVSCFTRRLEPVITDFLDALSEARQAYLHLDTSDIGSMVGGTEDWTRELRLMLVPFDDAPEQPNARPNTMAGRSTMTHYFFRFPRNEHFDPEYFAGPL